MAAMMSSRALMRLAILVGLCAIGTGGYAVGRYQAPQTVDTTAGSPAPQTVDTTAGSPSPSPPTTPPPHSAQAIAATAHSLDASESYAKFKGQQAHPL
jgi:hypothetical protein